MKKTIAFLALVLLLSPMIIVAAPVTAPVTGVIAKAVDPTAGSGYQASRGQLLSRTGTSQLYIKTGTSATAWTRIDAGAASSITGSGTANTVTKWTAASAIGDSSITDDGTTVTITGGTLDADAAVTLVGALRGKTVDVTTTGTLNDWAPAGYATATMFAVTPSGSIILNGISGGADGRIVVVSIVDNGVNGITLNHENAGSTAANRLDMAANATWTMGAGEAATFIYSGTLSRWVHIGTQRLPSIITSGNAQFGGSLIVTSTATLNGNVAAGDSDSDTTTIKGIPKDSGTAATLSTCGTSPTITGGSWAFSITFGTGSPTACTATFAQTKSATPSCVVSLRDPAEGVYVSAVSATAVTITAQTGTTDLSSNIADVVCIGDG